MVNLLPSNAWPTGTTKLCSRFEDKRDFVDRPLMPELLQNYRRLYEPGPFRISPFLDPASHEPFGIDLVFNGE